MLNAKTLLYEKININSKLFASYCRHVVLCMW